MTLLKPGSGFFNEEVIRKSNKLSKEEDKKKYIFLQTILLEMLNMINLIDDLTLEKSKIL